MRFFSHCPLGRSALRGGHCTNSEPHKGRSWAARSQSGLICAPTYTAMVLLVALYWLLKTSCELNGQQVMQALDTNPRTKQFLVERATQLMLALRGLGEGKADFSDCLIEHSAAGAGCGKKMTFDVGASKHAGMTLMTNGYRQIHDG